MLELHDSADRSYIHYTDEREGQSWDSSPQQVTSDKENYSVLGPLAAIEPPTDESSIGLFPLERIFI